MQAVAVLPCCVPNSACWGQGALPCTFRSRLFPERRRKSGVFEKKFHQMLCLQILQLKQSPGALAPLCAAGLVML